MSYYALSNISNRGIIHRGPRVAMPAEEKPRVRSLKGPELTRHAVEHELWVRGICRHAHWTIQQPIARRLTREVLTLRMSLEQLSPEECLRLVLDDLLGQQDSLAIAASRP